MSGIISFVSSLAFLIAMAKAIGSPVRCAAFTSVALPSVVVLLGHDRAPSFHLVLVADDVPTLRLHCSALGVRHQRVSASRNSPVALRSEHRTSKTIRCSAPRLM